jgi:hypothetical protein
MLLIYAVGSSAFAPDDAFGAFRSARYFDLRMGEEAILQDLLGAEFVPPMDQRDLGRMIGEIQSFFDSGVSAADDDHFLAAIEEAVAHRAGRDAISRVFRLAGAEAREILDVRRGRELTARLDARDQDRLQIRPRRIDRGCVAGGSGTDDEDARFYSGHTLPKLEFQFRTETSIL